VLQQNSGRLLRSLSPRISACIQMIAAALRHRTRLPPPGSPPSPSSSLPVAPGINAVAEARCMLLLLSIAPELLPLPMT
jgi:hypothetical protein